EELTLILRPSAVNGKEPTFSMGDDTPLPPFSEHRRTLYSFFKQRFAQVTNPAIDHLRERFVMSLRTLLGPRDPLLWERPEGAARVPRSSCRPTTRESHVHSRACWATVRRPSTRASRWPPLRASRRWAGPATPIPRTPSSPISRPSRRASLRCCPRWASPTST